MEQHHYVKHLHTTRHFLRNREQNLLNFQLNRDLKTIKKLTF